MANSDSGHPALGEAAARFLATLSHREREACQPEVYKFARWYGWEQPFAELSAQGVANYAEGLSLSDTDYANKLELVKAFLSYAKKEGWSQANLAVHLKAKKAKNAAAPSAKRKLPGTVSLTKEGYAELEAEIAALKARSRQLIEEIRRAAADKDFRENAPLHAAREERGHVEGRIMELQEILKAATVINQEQKKTLKAGIGDSIVLCDLNSGEELHYMLVDPREVDPVQGRISHVSPIGKAVVGRDEGDVVEIAVPAGKLRYQIKQIKR